MGDGVITSPHDFNQQSHWDYRVQEGIKYEIRAVTYGITSMQNLMNFRPAITRYEMRTDGHYLRRGWVGLGWVRFGQVSGAQNIMDSGVIIIHPHDLMELSCWCHLEFKVENYKFAVVTYGITTTPNFIKFPCSHSHCVMCTDGPHLSKGEVRLG
jgi:hypothetical protein